MVAPPLNVCRSHLSRMARLEEAEEFQDDAAVSAAGFFGNRALHKGIDGLEIKPFEIESTLRHGNQNRSRLRRVVGHRAILSDRTSLSATIIIALAKTKVKR